MSPLCPFNATPPHACLLLPCRADLLARALRTACSDPPPAFLHLPRRAELLARALHTACSDVGEGLSGGGRARSSSRALAHSGSSIRGMGGGLSYSHSYSPSSASGPLLPPQHPLGLPGSSGGSGAQSLSDLQDELHLRLQAALLDQVEQREAERQEAEGEGGGGAGRLSNDVAGQVGWVEVVDGGHQVGCHMCHGHARLYMCRGHAWWGLVEWGVNMWGGV